MTPAAEVAAASAESGSAAAAAKAAAAAGAAAAAAGYTGARAGAGGPLEASRSERKTAAAAEAGSREEEKRAAEAASTEGRGAAETASREGGEEAAAGAAGGSPGGAAVLRSEGEAAAMSTKDIKRTAGRRKETATRAATRRLAENEAAAAGADAPSGRRAGDTTVRRTSGVFYEAAEATGEFPSSSSTAATAHEERLNREPWFAQQRGRAICTPSATTAAAAAATAAAATAAPFGCYSATTETAAAALVEEVAAFLPYSSYYPFSSLSAPLPIPTQSTAAAAASTPVATPGGEAAAPEADPSEEEEVAVAAAAAADCSAATRGATAEELGANRSVAVHEAAAGGRDAAPAAGGRDAAAAGGRVAAAAAGGGRDAAAAGGRTAAAAGTGAAAEAGGGTNAAAATGRGKDAAAAGATHTAAAVGGTDAAAAAAAARKTARSVSTNFDRLLPFAPAAPEAATGSAADGWVPAAAAACVCGASAAGAVTPAIPHSQLPAAAPASSASPSSSSAPSPFPSFPPCSSFSAAATAPSATAATATAATPATAATAAGVGCGLTSCCSRCISVTVCSRSGFLPVHTSCPCGTSASSSIFPDFSYFSSGYPCIFKSLLPLASAGQEPSPPKLLPSPFAASTAPAATFPAAAGSPSPAVTAAAAVFLPTAASPRPPPSRPAAADSPPPPPLAAAVISSPVPPPAAAVVSASFSPVRRQEAGGDAAAAVAAAAAFPRGSAAARPATRPRLLLLLLQLLLLRLLLLLQDADHLLMQQSPWLPHEFFPTAAPALAQIRVQAPRSLVEELIAMGSVSPATRGAIIGSTAAFGTPTYGEVLRGKAFYAPDPTPGSSEKTGGKGSNGSREERKKGEEQQHNPQHLGAHCTPHYCEYLKPEIRRWRRIQGASGGLRHVIFVVERGVCTFTTKARVAQQCGANALIVVDRGLPGWSRSYIRYNVIMSDDGTGEDIVIPSILIAREEGDALISSIQAGQRPRPTPASSSFPFPSPFPSPFAFPGPRSRSPPTQQEQGNSSNSSSSNRQRASAEGGGKGDGVMGGTAPTGATAKTSASSSSSSQPAQQRGAAGGKGEADGDGEGRNKAQEGEIGGGRGAADTASSLRGVQREGDAAAGAAASDAATAASSNSSSDEGTGQTHQQDTAAAEVAGKAEEEKEQVEEEEDYLKEEVPVLLELEWNIPLQWPVCVDFWYDPGDAQGARFLEDLAPYMLLLRFHVRFRPLFFIFEVEGKGSEDLCLSEGLYALFPQRYCSVDPAAQSLTHTGRDVAEESLRQACLHKKTEETSIHLEDSLFSSAFWKYQKMLADPKQGCFFDGKEGNAWGRACSLRVMRSILPAGEMTRVEECVAGTEGKQLLDASKNNRGWSPVALQINGARFSGTLDAEAAVRAICAATRDPDSGELRAPECEEILSAAHRERSPWLKEMPDWGSFFVVLLLVGVILACAAALYFWTVKQRLLQAVQYEVLAGVHQHFQHYYEMAEHRPLPASRGSYSSLRSGAAAPSSAGRLSRSTEMQRCCNSAAFFDRSGRTAAKT